MTSRSTSSGKRSAACPPRSTSPPAKPRSPAGPRPDPKPPRPVNVGHPPAPAVKQPGTRAFCDPTPEQGFPFPDSARAAIRCCPIPNPGRPVALPGPMSILLQDVRLALRQLRKNPAFAAMTIVTLALGIGATTAIFTLVNAVWLRPLPFPAQDRLVWMRQLDRTLPPGANQEPLSYPDYFDWRAQSRSFTGLASYRHRVYTLTG